MEKKERRKKKEKMTKKLYRYTIYLYYMCEC